jgi:PKD repeat protein
MMKYASVVAALALISSVSIVSCKKDEQSHPSKISYTGVPITGNSLSFRSDGTGVTKYFWDFGDSTTSDQANPTHAYAKPGKYDVLLMLNGNPSTVSWTHVSVCKDPIHTKKIGSAWRWTHKERDIRTGVDAVYNDTTFSVTFIDPISISIDGGAGKFSYEQDKSIDTVLVFERIAAGASHDMPDTTHTITFYATKDSIIYDIFQGYSNINVGRTTTYRTKK